MKQYEKANDQAKREDLAEKFFAVYFKQIKAYLITYFKSKGYPRNEDVVLRAEEVTQEILERALLEKRKHILENCGDNEKAFRWYLIKMARNEYIDRFFRDPYHEKTLSETEAHLSVSQVPDPSPNVEQTLMDEEQRKRDLDIAKMQIKELPSNYRDVLVKMFLEGKSRDQIEKELGISRNNMEQRISRALKTIYGESKTEYKLKAKSVERK